MWFGSPAVRQSGSPKFMQNLSVLHFVCSSMFLCYKIAEISPNTRLIVSPILPTAIPALNLRIVAFNRLLVSQRAWWQELPLGDFIADNNLIASQFLSFNKERDKIHLGYRGREANIAGEGNYQFLLTEGASTYMQY